MFTGIVRQAASVVANEPRGEGRRLRIAVALAPEDRELGASIAVAGVCLTVVATGAAEVAFDLGAETLRDTTLGRVGPGHRVNLEPALRLRDALGGHFVSGHVDGVATVLRMERRAHEGGGAWLEVEPPAQLRRFVALKGAVTLDGVSLTVQALSPGICGLGLVPHTLEVTTLGELRPGSQVNLEVDILARHVARLLEEHALLTTPSRAGASQA